MCVGKHMIEGSLFISLLLEVLFHEQVFERAFFGTVEEAGETVHLAFAFGAGCFERPVFEVGGVYFVD